MAVLYMRADITSLRFMLTELSPGSAIHLYPYKIETYRTKPVYAKWCNSPTIGLKFNWLRYRTIVISKNTYFNNNMLRPKLFVT